MTPAANVSAPSVARLPGHLVLAVAAASLALASCNRDKPAAPPARPPVTPAVVTPAAAGAPFDYKSADTYADVSLKLPDGVKGQPGLHAALYAAAVRDLKTFAEGAQADRTEAGGDGGQQPYEKTITFDPPVETGKLLSLAREDYEFTGGAHGMTNYGGVIWDKAMKRELQPAALFKTTNLTPLDIALCAAINAEKKKRDPSAKAIGLSGGDWTCPKASDTPFVLAAGTTSGKAGGLTFLIGPYQVGSYAEGTFQVTVPQATIRDLLSPAYADEFAGTPLPTPPST
ncbi:hypothetical protein BH10PSE2_BH10PSE2_30610 [soil metagenome]